MLVKNIGKRGKRRIEAFELGCWRRRLLRIIWRERLRNEVVLINIKCKFINVEKHN